MPFIRLKFSLIFDLIFRYSPSMYITSISVNSRLGRNKKILAMAMGMVVGMTAFYIQRMGRSIAAREPVTPYQISAGTTATE